MPSVATQLSRRFLFAHANRFARVVTWISFLGLAIGVMVLTVVVNVMNGFDHELKTRLLRSLPHVTLQTTTTSMLQAQTNAYETQLDAYGEHFRFYRGVGVISTAGRVATLGLYAVPGAALQQGLDLGADNESALRSLADIPYGMVVGAPVARAFGLSLGDAVQVMVAKSKDGRVQPKLLTFNLVGTFELGADPDYNLAIVNLDRFALDSWNEMGEVGVQLQLAEPMRAGTIANALSGLFPDFLVSSWESQYGELFRAVRLEKSMMFVLLLLVVAIASFNIVAGQSMLVNDKTRSIAILRTMGLKRRTVGRVFLMQGVFISVSGTLLGLGLGLLASFQINAILDGLQGLTGMHLLDGSFFVEVPVQVQGLDLVMIGCLSLVLSTLSAWLPANRAAQLDPVAGLH